MPLRGPTEYRNRIPAGDFEARCLRLMDRVKETGVEYVITRRNRPVAKLAPVTDDDLRPFVGRSRGVITASRQDLMAPIGEDWEVDADLGPGRARSAGDGHAAEKGFCAAC